MYIVSYYNVDRAFGGPEEGGWWYTYGIPETQFDRFTRGFATEDEAYVYADRLNRHLSPKLNEGRYSISSVLSDGNYQAIVSEGYPRPFPEETPYYN
jgi:hypothetical protein